MKRVFAAALLAALSCNNDDVIEDQVALQGNEVERVPVGEFHRAGRRCVVCHHEGGESSEHPFVVAGTIFAQQKRDVGVGGAEVLLTDSDGSKFIAKTNCVGNFFVKPADWAPKYPIIVDIQKSGVRRSMRSAIGREGDCGSCHKVAVTNPLAEMEHVYLFGTDEPGLPGGDPACPVDPVRPGAQ